VDEALHAVETVELGGGAHVALAVEVHLVARVEGRPWLKTVPEAQVELAAAVEQRPLQVLLHDPAAVHTLLLQELHDVLDVLEELDAAALA